MRLWLKKLRLKQQLSQSNVAAACNCSLQHYSYIENGDRRPSPEVAKRIANVLGFKNEWYKLLES